MSKVIATADGYDNVQLRKKGDVFECPKNGKGEEIVKASWYQPHKSKAKAVEEPSNDGQAPIT